MRCGACGPVRKRSPGQAGEVERVVPTAAAAARRRARHQVDQLPVEKHLLRVLCVLQLQPAAARPLRRQHDDLLLLLLLRVVVALAQVVVLLLRRRQRAQREPQRGGAAARLRQQLELPRRQALMLGRRAAHGGGQGERGIGRRAAAIGAAEVRQLDQARAHDGRELRKLIVRRRLLVLVLLLLGRRRGALDLELRAAGGAQTRGGATA